MYFRKDLRHQDVPRGVAWNCDFCVTICAFPRNQNHFCRNPVGSIQCAQDSSIDQRTGHGYIRFL